MLHTITNSIALSIIQYNEYKNLYLFIGNSRVSKSSTNYATTQAKFNILPHSYKLSISRLNRDKKVIGKVLIVLLFAKNYFPLGNYFLYAFLQKFIKAHKARVQLINIRY